MLPASDFLLIILLLLGVSYDWSTLESVNLKLMWRACTKPRKGWLWSLTPCCFSSSFFSFSLPLSLLDEFLMNNFEKNSLYVFCLIGFPLTRYFWKFRKMMNCMHMQLFQFISSLDWQKYKQIRIGVLTVEEVNMQLRQLLCASEPELKTSVHHLPF